MTTRSPCWCWARERARARSGHSCWYARARSSAMTCTCAQADGSSSAKLHIVAGYTTLHYMCTCINRSDSSDQLVSHHVRTCPENSAKVWTHDGYFFSGRNSLSNFGRSPFMINTKSPPYSWGWHNQTFLTLSAQTVCRHMILPTHRTLFLFCWTVNLWLPFLNIC